MPKTNTKTPPQTTTLTTNSRSKISLNKRRPLSRNNTQLTLTKTTATNNYHHHKNTKNKKKGAFKGALDPDPEDEQHEQQTQKKDDQVWVSEPSTRCTTPNQQQNQLENTPIKLELQLPNPLPLPPLSHHQQKSPSPPPHQPTITPSSLLSSSTSSTSSSSSSSSSINEESLPDPPETRGRSKSRHRTNEPTIEPVPRPRQVSLSQPAASTPPAIPNSSEQLSQTTTPSPTMLPNKGKAKASPGSSKPPRGNRSSVNSVRSLSSLVILHNDAHLKAPNTTRLALKRVDSAASIVLPPKIDTTEAVITLNGKAAFNPTLMSISDFPSEISPASPLPNTPTSSPVATTSKTCTMSNSPPSFQPDELSRLPQPPSPTSVNLEQSECALRLKKYSNATRPRHLVNVRAANEPPSGLISSLLSPGLTFKSRRSDPHPGAGYFDSFKSLVGISSLAEQVTEEEGHSKAEPDRSSTLASRSSPRPVHALTGTLSQSKRDATPGVSLNGVRYPFVQSQKLLGHARPAQPKPAIPGMMTTCGPLPVQSKFLGPRPAPPATSPQPEPSASSRSAPSDGTSAASNDVVDKKLSEPTVGRQLHGPEGGRTLSRIQKKLLMERDRPISPTLLNHPSPPSPACPPCSSTSTVTTVAPPAAATLPPPSYLIRSLGGQIGPLPFIPLDLLPPDTLPPTSSNTTSSALSSHHHDPSSSTSIPDLPPRLNQPALKAKQALSIKLWRNSLIDEVEQVLTDHESNTRFRNPLFESLIRVSSHSAL